MSERSKEFNALYRTYRLQDQRDYYLRRRDEYRRAHAQAVGTRNVLFMLAAGMAAVAQATNGTVRACLGIGAAAFSGLAAAVAAFDALIGFPTLQKVYDDASANLATVDETWDDNAEDIGETVELVEQMLLAENAQWGKLSVQQADGVRTLVPQPSEGGF